jgi:DNA-binding CsgD family transcriptional regulator
MFDLLADRCPDAKRAYYLRLDVAMAAAAGDRQEAERLLDQIVSGEPFLDDAYTPNAVHHLVEQLLGVGVDPSVVRATVIDGWLGDHPSAEMFAAITAGPLSIAAGRAADAVTPLRAVLDAPDPCLVRPVIGSLRTSLAEALLAAGDRVGALAAVRQAIDDDLARWPGVQRDRAEALARRVQGSSVRAAGVLTTREREVAALLAEGLTNGQLAERLFISPKTAAVHVSNILAKLGLASRAEIAAWAVRHSVAA